MHCSSYDKSLTKADVSIKAGAGASEPFSLTMSHKKSVNVVSTFIVLPDGVPTYSDSAHSLVSKFIGTMSKDFLGRGIHRSWSSERRGYALLHGRVARK